MTRYRTHAFSHLPARQRQAGITLIVGLIILIMISLAVVATYNMGRSSLEIVGNMQYTNEVVDSANATIQEAISTTRMVENPATTLLNGCNGTNTRCFDVNSDGQNDIAVALTPIPRCVQSQTILNGSLNVATNADRACLTSAHQLHGIEGAETGNSLCAQSVWEITAVATDASGATGNRMTVVQGAAVRVAVDDALTSCP